MNDREATILLNLISGIGYVKYRALVSAFGTPSEVFRATETDLLEVAGIGPQLAKRLARWPEEYNLEEELALAERSGVRIATLLDETYPEILRGIFDPPLCLYVRGKLPDFRQDAIAVVGSRRMSDYGRRVTQSLTAEAVAAKIVIVSGLAFGVDTVAHQTTVECGGVTVAVLGGGLANVQPQENVPLARRIVETGGAVISEFPMRFPVSRTSFPRRNRIVAGLSRLCLVTEAGEQSGALITARLAMEFGREVMAVPGRIDNPQMRGCHKLIKEGAGLVEDFRDVANALGFGLLPGFAPGGDELFEAAAPYGHDGTADLPPDCREICRLLREAPEQSFDALHGQTQWELGRLSATLVQLELLLTIRRSGDQLYSLR